MKRKILLVAIIIMICSLPVFSAGNKEATASDKGSGPYPSKAVECIMAASAGGGTDLQIRAIAPFFSEKFGQDLSQSEYSNGNY